MTPAGTTFLQDIRRLFTNLEQARENVRAIAAATHAANHISAVLLLAVMAPPAAKGPTTALSEYATDRLLTFQAISGVGVLVAAISASVKKAVTKPPSRWSR